jgi:hypothetical protein
LRTLEGAIEAEPDEGMSLTEFVRFAAAADRHDAKTPTG